MYNGIMWLYQWADLNERKKNLVNEMHTKISLIKKRYFSLSWFMRFLVYVCDAVAITDDFNSDEEPPVCEV